MRDRFSRLFEVRQETQFMQFWKKERTCFGNVHFVEHHVNLL